MKKFLKALIPVICVTICIAFNSCKKPEEKPAGMHESRINEGFAAAESWIKHIDSANYRESRSSASEIFRKTLTEEQWIKSISAARKPLGKNTGRVAASREFMTELPGVPDGEYVLIKYRSSFEKKRHAVEIVTMVKDPDGKWRGAGYFIK